MSEETTAPVSEETQDAIAEPSPGARLQQAREAIGMDLDEAARQLCLSPRQVAALEADDIAQLPSPTFARGFIRNYAKLLHLDADSLLSGYQGKAEPASSSASISLHSEGIPIDTGNRKAWMAYFIASILIVLAGLGWWAYMDWRENMPPAPAETGKQTSAVPAAAATRPGAETQPEPVPMGAGKSASELMQAPAEAAAPMPANAASATVAAPAANTAVAASAAAPTAGGRIVMTFTQPSWVRVSDRDGKEIFLKNQPGSGQEVVDGNPPLKLDIGNAVGVQVSYNGKPVDLAPSTKANGAPLTLE